MRHFHLHLFGQRWFGRYQAISLCLLGFWGLTLTGCNTPTQAVSPQVSDAELEKRVLEIIRKNPQVVLDSVRAYQEQQRAAQQKQRQEFLAAMQANPAATVGRSPSIGASDQKVVLLKFSDFQCSYCALSHNTLKEFVEKNRDRVTLVYKHFPLMSIHPEAMPAAKASWAAQQQGKFWEYNEALFKQQDQLSESLYVEIARSLNLDLTKFNRDRSSAEAEAAVRLDMELAEKIGVDGTPFLIMNGVPIPANVKVSELEQVLTQIVARSKAK